MGSEPGLRSGEGEALVLQPESQDLVTTDWTWSRGTMRKGELEMPMALADCSSLWLLPLVLRCPWGTAQPHVKVPAFSP